MNIFIHIHKYMYVYITAHACIYIEIYCSILHSVAVCCNPSVRSAAGRLQRLVVRG